MRHSLKVTNVSSSQSLIDQLAQQREVKNVCDGSLMNTKGYEKVLSLEEKLIQAKAFLQEFHLENKR